MEECLDWDVEVEAAVHTYGLASVPTQPLKKHVQKIERTFQTQKAHGKHMASSRNTSISAVSVKSKNNTTEKQQRSIPAMPCSKLSSTPHSPDTYQKNLDVFPSGSHTNHLPGVLSAIDRKIAWEGFSGSA